MKNIFKVLIFAGIIGLLFFYGCKDSENGDGTEFTLTVTTSDGVTGTPAAGAYTYSENSTVSYSYSAGSGYIGLDVTLDGVPVAASGSVTMNGNHTLAANAESYDVRGKWRGSAWQGGGGGDTLFKCNFSGGILSGTTRGQVLALNSNWVDGEFTVSNGNQIEFDLVYSQGAQVFIFTGTITDNKHMNGTWEWYENDKFVMNGGWELEKED